MTSWSTASRAQRAAALALIGTTIDLVVLDLKDAAMGNQALKDEIKRCSTREQLEQLAVEWFGDLGRPQPTDRTHWPGWPDAPVAIWSILKEPSTVYRTPDWPGGRLPPIDDLLAEPPATPARGRGRAGHAYPVELLQDILDLARERHGRAGIQDRLKSERYPAGLGASEYIVKNALQFIRQADEEQLRRLEEKLEEIRDLPPARRFLTLEAFRNGGVEPDLP